MVYDGRREHEHCNDNQHHSTSVQQTGRNVPFETWAAKPTNGKSLDRRRHNGFSSPMATRATHLVQTALARRSKLNFQLGGKERGHLTFLKETEGPVAEFLFAQRRDSRVL